VSGLTTPIGELRNFVLDVDDLDVAERFWVAVTGLPVRFRRLDGRYTRLGTDRPGSILLQLVPEAKDERKNRAHLDLTVTDLGRAVEQVVALGGSRVSDPIGYPVEEPGVEWVVVADPSGNEFCLVQDVG
jgi:predicted enzyme related to lactoylglutathione lyase